MSHACYSFALNMACQAKITEIETIRNRLLSEVETIQRSKAVSNGILCILPVYLSFTLEFSL
jgi:hypothetical protein